MVPRAHHTFFALAATTSGAVRMLMAFMPWQDENTMLEILAALIDAGFLFGLIGLYLRTADRIRTVGAVGFFLAFVGIASILGPDPVFLGINLYQTGSGIAAAGLASLSAHWLFSGTGPTLSAILWIGAALIGAWTIYFPILFMPAGFLFGAGFMTAGLWLNAQQAEKHQWI